MQLNITGRHVDISDALRDFVNTKLKKLERHFDHITHAHVILTVDKLNNKAEATLHSTGAELFAEAEGENMYTAIDKMVDKLDRQLLKHKDKMQKHTGVDKRKAMEEVE